MRGGDRVAAGAVPPNDFDSVIRRDIIEGTTRELREELSREPHSANAAADQLAARCAADFSRQEPPIEVRVVRSVHMTGDYIE